MQAFCDVLSGKGGVSSMVSDILSCTAILPENELKVKPFLEELANEEGTTIDELLDALVKKVIKPVRPDNPVTDEIINAASVIRVDRDDQQILADAITRNGIDNQKLIQTGIAAASIGAFTVLQLYGILCQHIRDKKLAKFGVAMAMKTLLAPVSGSLPF